MKAREKWSLPMLSSRTLNNSPISNSQELRVLIHIRHEKTSISNDVRIKCVIKCHRVRKVRATAPNRICATFALHYSIEDAFLLTSTNFRPIGSFSS